MKRTAHRVVAQVRRPSPPATSFHVMQKIRITINLAALLTAGTGFYALADHWPGMLDFVRFFFYFLGDSSRLPIWTPVLGIILYLTLFGKIIAAYGLFRLRKWAWKLALVVLSIDFSWHLFAAVYHFVSFRHSKTPPVPPGTITVTVSLWPSYIICILSLFSIILLARKPVRTVFENA